MTLRTLRFEEFYRYDIFSDEEVVDLMAITNIGTYRAVVPVNPARKLRLRRDGFKQYVLQDMALNKLPHELELWETENGDMEYRPFDQEVVIG